MAPFPAPLPVPAHKRQRRTATAVVAGHFDIPPQRDVLTSVLNSNPYKAVEKSEEARRRKQEKKKKRQLESQKQKEAAKSLTMASADVASGSTLGPAPGRKNAVPSAKASGKLPVFHFGRPQINIIMPRSMSVTPPPMPPSPSPTPGPCTSSTTSHRSSKRPHTPVDTDREMSATAASHPAPQLRKKRPVVRKGWKGWVEGSPPPSEKLINLDSAPILQERRTRNGKSFGAIGETGWA